MRKNDGVDSTDMMNEDGNDLKYGQFGVVCFISLLRRVVLGYLPPGEG